MHTFLKQALALAQRGIYTTSPNPHIGCVLVKNNHIIGEGFTQVAGQAHAEIMALRDCQTRGESPEGATAYVTLEPCNHHGRTPPCTQALIAAKVKKVVILMLDPNPKVAGAGMAALQAAGIETEILESHDLLKQAQDLNVGFFHRMRTGLPWVRLKIAASVDGITALPNGQSQWITGEAARIDGHHWRARACALLTGIGTVQADNPLLNVRHVSTPRQPWRVVVDSELQISPQAKIFKGSKVLLVCAQPQAENIAALRAQWSEEQVEIIQLPNAQGKVDLPELMRELARREVNELHVEAGFKLNGSLLREGCVNELLIYLAPSLLGHGAGLANLPELQNLNQAQRLKFIHTTQIGEDIRILASLV